MSIPDADKNSSTGGSPESNCPAEQWPSKTVYIDGAFPLSLTAQAPAVGSTSPSAIAEATADGEALALAPAPASGPGSSSQQIAAAALESFDPQLTSVLVSDTSDASYSGATARSSTTISSESTNDGEELEPDSPSGADDVAGRRRWRARAGEDGGGGADSADGASGRGGRGALNRGARERERERRGRRTRRQGQGGTRRGNAGPDTQSAGLGPGSAVGGRPVLSEAELLEQVAKTKRHLKFSLGLSAALTMIASLGFSLLTNWVFGLFFLIAGVSLAFLARQIFQPISVESQSINAVFFAISSTSFALLSAFVWLLLLFAVFKGGCPSANDPSGPEKGTLGETSSTRYLAASEGEGDPFRVDQLKAQIGGRDNAASSLMTPDLSCDSLRRIQIALLASLPLLSIISGYT